MLQDLHITAILVLVDMSKLTHRVLHLRVNAHSLGASHATSWVAMFVGWILVPKFLMDGLRCFRTQLLGIVSLDRWDEESHHQS